MSSLAPSASLRCLLCDVRTPAEDFTMLRAVGQSVCNVCAALTAEQRDTLRTQAMTRMLILAD
jgi:hypothetical protein